jgi:hypothetical protein
MTRYEPVTVAVVNTNPDLIRLIRVSLERAGFVVFEIHSTRACAFSITLGARRQFVLKGGAPSLDTQPQRCRHSPALL